MKLIVKRGPGSHFPYSLAHMPKEDDDQVACCGKVNVGGAWELADESLPLNHICTNCRKRCGGRLPKRKMRR